MPGMGGMEFIDHVRERFPDIRIIMITGFATLSTAMQALRRGAFDYVAKPYSREELINVVFRAVKHGPMEPARAKKKRESNDDPLAPGNYYSLRGHTWSKIEEDGRILIGIEKEFYDLIGAIASIDCTPSGEHISQGKPFAQIVATDNRIHKLLSPFSGRVLEQNGALIANPMIGCGLRGDCWLIRIDPTGIEYEIDNVTRL